MSTMVDGVGTSVYGCDGVGLPAAENGGSRIEDGVLDEWAAKMFKRHKGNIGFCAFCAFLRLRLLQFYRESLHEQHILGAVQREQFERIEHHCRQ